MQGVNAFVCEFPVNYVFDQTSLAPFATAQFGVTIQAVGGRGGDGGSTVGTLGEGTGGAPGLAQTTLRGDALTGKSLYLYVAHNGNFGASGKGGNGGAATVVATRALNPEPQNLDDILLVAAGGGGGQGFNASAPTPSTCITTPIPNDANEQSLEICDGGQGGVAIAFDVQNRIGTRQSAQQPTLWFNEVWLEDGLKLNATNGLPPYFDAGTWHGGSANPGGTAGSSAFSFAGSTADHSSSAGTWVRETPALTLGDVIVLGGQGKDTGGAGGGGVAGGGGSGNGGGGGGASFAIGSGYGLNTSDSFIVPCETEGFCAQNWLSPAGVDEPAVVITFWQNQGANPLIPSDGDTINSDQPSLVYKDEDASDGIQYLVKNIQEQQVNFSGFISRSATGNFLWTVPTGLLEDGETYEWFISDRFGNTLQDTESFTLDTGSASNGFTLGWSLYVRSMDNVDTGLPVDLQPFDGQTTPTTSTSCSCSCTESLSQPLSTPVLQDNEFPSCSGFVKKDPEGCTCTWKGNGDNPAYEDFWDWSLETGSSCISSSGECYANAKVNVGAIDIDWSSPNNSLNLLVPSRLINLTSEPPSPADGSAVPSLALPAIQGSSGDCADPDQIEITFTSVTNGGIEFSIWANPTTGEPQSSPSTANKNWVNTKAKCSFSIEKDTPNKAENSNLFTNAYLIDQLYLDCQTPIKEDISTQSFCLTPQTPYRVRFDATVPYVPGPMRLGFILAGMESSAPIPANWISSCTLDASTGNCEQALDSFLGIPGYLNYSSYPWRYGSLGKFWNLLLSNQYDAPRHDQKARRKHNKRTTSLYRRHAARYPGHFSKPAYHWWRRRPGMQSSTLLTGEEGTSGESSCSSAGNTVTCTWTENGVWELPALYTQPGGWITVQALGGSGGNGFESYNVGGQGGRAQAVIPSESLAGESLYMYVGENGTDAYNADCMGIPDGCAFSSSAGAASVVTSSAIPDAFVSDGCGGSAEDLNALVIAGGGGSGGMNGFASTAVSKGGNAGIAIAGSGIQNIIGSGSSGTADPTSFAGLAPIYGSNPFDGTQFVSNGYVSVVPTGPPEDPDRFVGGAPNAFGGGYNQQYAHTWLANSSSLSLSVAHIQACSGGQSLLQGGSGGGGHAAGGGGISQQNTMLPTNLADWKYVYGAGGAGGSSWAKGAGAGVTLPETHSGWRTLASNEPSQVVISIECPLCVFISDCAMQSSSQRPIMRCTFDQSFLPVNLNDLAQAVAIETGQNVTADVPVYLEAWGGYGGHGGDAFNGCGSSQTKAVGGNGGEPGYARASFTFGALTDIASDLWFYVGAKGGDGPSHTNEGCNNTFATPGAGGAASLVLTEALNSALSLDNTLLIAAGGGGGGQGRVEELKFDGQPGENGGYALATTDEAVTAAGASLLTGGDNGTGACGVDPLVTYNCGSDGIGGRGGSVDNGSNTTGWVGTSSSWSHGQGGRSKGGSTDGGAGGGGYGAGMAGGSGFDSSEGGGAGGSYAAIAALDDTGAPVLGPDGSPSNGNGVVVISFDICSTDPTLAVCQR